jgi:hypothetical protein
MFASRLAGPLTAGFFVKQPKASCVEEDLEALLVRMRQQRYPSARDAVLRWQYTDSVERRSSSG